MNTPAPIPILILAAGASRRMRGGDKLLEPVDGRPLLRAQAEAAVATGAPVFVTLPAESSGRDAALKGLDLSPIVVADAWAGMAASLRAGLAALPADAVAAMIVLADMPEITAADLDALLAAFRADTAAPILRATGADGTPGHPVIFPADLFGELAELSGDRGARAIIAAHPERLKLFSLPERHALTDLNTPEAWAAWRAARR